ncbi:pathogen-associated molecular patterns-induced protein A70-like [Juglans microcarpa x Juglans regia]|uniref:pathogen-associated molecular patterns-induced protein A70-like n=1 Tax=Juglans microcarpa x Juglans regia TaxID=2249226 RepID=UPI001B7D9D39|nr:pathogen-associated molecular patterns-induced protein A70-like [Juglans microcarpa x Juglans regia]
MSSIWAFMASWFTPTSLFVLLNLTIFAIILTSRLGSQRKPHEQQHHHHQLEQAPSFLNRVRSINFSLYKFEKPNAADPVTEFFQPAGVLDHVGIPYQNPDHPSTSQLARSPSLLDRLKSINFSLYKFEQPNVADPVTEFFQPTSVVDHVEISYQNPDHPSTTQLARSPSLLDRLKSINVYSLYRSDSSAMESEILHPTEPDQGTRNLKAETDNMIKRSNSDNGVGVPKRPAVEKITKSASEKSALGSSEEIKTGRALPDEEVDAKADDFINRFKQQLRLQRLDSLQRYRESLNRNN